MLAEIKNKSCIDIDMFIARLENELNIDNVSDKEKKKKATTQLICAIYDTLIIILDKTHQDKVPKGLYTTWLGMIKDYWCLNQYDKKYVLDNSFDSNDSTKIKSIQVGDTTTTFADTSSQIDINGTTYNTGTINYSDNILVEKYKKALYEHRKMGW